MLGRGAIACQGADDGHESLPPLHFPAMDPRSRPVLLAVFGTGVFLAGLELMITAVALPSILADLVTASGTSAWVELRKASWIINGYLLVYILMMPLAGRLADLWGARRLFMGALVVFTVGSVLAGLAQTLDQLIAARLVQAVGGGVLVPVGTAAAAHLYGGHGRARALGVIGALTFLGMAAGPFLGAAILSAVHPEAVLVGAGLGTSTLAAVLEPAWRWIFYVNVPIAIVALVLAWAVEPGWETPRRTGRVDVGGALIFGVALASGLVALTLIGAQGEGRRDPDTGAADDRPRYHRHRRDDRVGGARRARGRTRSSTCGCSATSHSVPPPSSRC